ncbi:hypothetical protein PRA75_17480, partial [Klebsiella pneumoniae]
KRAYCLKTQPATGETYPKSDLFNKAPMHLTISESSACSISEFPHTGHNRVIFLLYFSGFNFIYFHLSYIPFLVADNMDAIGLKLWRFT